MMYETGQDPKGWAAEKRGSWSTHELEVTVTGTKWGLGLSSPKCELTQRVKGRGFYTGG